MLSDNAERSKNPLKKAMRRRNAKTVVFSEPTYYEASDYDYSTDDEEQDQDGLEDGGEAEPNEMQHDQPDDQDEITAVEPLRPNASAAKSATDTSVSVVNAPDANESRVRSSTDDNAASKSEAEDRIGKQRNGSDALGARQTDSGSGRHRQTSSCVWRENGFVLGRRHHGNAQDYAHAESAPRR